MKNVFLIVLGTYALTPAMAAEVPLCALPQDNNEIRVDAEIDPGCAPMIADAKKVAAAVKSNTLFTNKAPLPAQLSIGAVYLQPITMSPEGMMRSREQSDIHLELDIHAKENLKTRGFAPGDWLPNVDGEYTIQKIGSTAPLKCTTHMGNTASSTACKLMPMVASDGAHYGDNVKLDGPGFYIVTFTARTNPHFGWHTDTESKILGTEYVNWHFTQSYLFKWTGIGKKGGY